MWPSPSDLVNYGFASVLFSISILLLMVTVNVPYWSVTDRIWKTKEDEENDA